MWLLCVFNNCNKNNVFVNQYRIEVRDRGRWGGIWKAPVSYSFVSTSDQQTQIILTQKFDSWSYSSSGESIGKRMPYIDTCTSHPHGLLMTKAKDTYKWWGTMAMNASSSYKSLFGPCPWIHGVGKENIVGLGLYWLRENHTGRCNSMYIDFLTLAVKFKRTTISTTTCLYVQKEVSPDQQLSS